MSLTIATETISNGLILKLSGSAGFADADVMQSAVTRAIASRPALVVVDLSGLTDLSSLFAGQLVSLHNGLKHHSGRAVLAAPCPRVAEALDRMRIGLITPLFPSVDAALAAPAV